MELTVVQKTVRGLIAIGVLFVITVLSSAFLSYRLTDLDYWTRHTHMVLEELQRALSSLQDVETGERGFLYTGEKEFLQPYEQGAAAALQNIDQVQLLTQDNPQEQEAVKHLRDLARQKIDLAKQDIASSDHINRDALVEGQKKGKATMDALRLQIKRMSDTEEGLLQQRVSDLKFTQTTIVLSSVANC